MRVQTYEGDEQGTSYDAPGRGLMNENPGSWDRRLGPLEGLARAGDLLLDDAGIDVIVDEPHRLHEGVHSGRADELPAEFLQIFRERHGLRRGRYELGAARRLRGFVAPDERSQRPFLLHELTRSLSVVDHRLDLAPVAHDARISEQARDVLLLEARDAIEIEVMKGGAKVLAFSQDGAPAEPRLKPLETKLLEQPAVVGHRKTPLAIVVFEKLRRRTRPLAALFLVGTKESFTHVRLSSSGQTCASQA